MGGKQRREERGERGKGALRENPGAVYRRHRKCRGMAGRKRGVWDTHTRFPQSPLEEGGEIRQFSKKKSCDKNDRKREKTVACDLCKMLLDN